VSLSQEEAFARIRLLRSPNIGPVSYAQLLRRFGDAQRAVEALPDLASRGGRAYRPTPSERIEDEVAEVRSAGARYLFHDSPDYPALLGENEGAPPILIARGDLSLAGRPCVAMVGARNASAGAVKLARDFAAALAEAGFVIVSGLAGKRSEDEEKEIRDYFLSYAAPEPLRTTHGELVALEQQKADLVERIPTAMVMAEMKNPRDTFVLERGDYRNQGEKVTPGVPAMLPPLPSDAPLTRLTLAKWLVQPDHPLTSRVAVNRYWQMYFGTGLVKTQEDFGVQGEPPR